MDIPGIGSSQTCILKWGVPQGSILGNLLFSLYTAPLGDIAERHDVEHSFYAVDAQIYNTLETAQKEHILQKCVDNYREWMVAND